MAAKQAPHFQLDSVCELNSLLTFVWEKGISDWVIHTLHISKKIPFSGLALDSSQEVFSDPMYIQPDMCVHICQRPWVILYQFDQAVYVNNFLIVILSFLCYIILYIQKLKNILHVIILLFITIVLAICINTQNVQV